MRVQSFNAVSRLTANTVEATAEQASQRLVSGLRAFSRFTGGLLPCAGGAVLLGWLLGLEPLKRMWPGFVAMNPLTAICFILAGLSLTCLWQARASGSAGIFRCGQVMGAAIIVVGMLKLGQHLWGWEFTLDHMLFKEALDADPTGMPNRMAPNTAFSILVCGSVLVLLNSATRRTSSVAQALSLLLGFHTVLVLLGYLYHARLLYGVGEAIPMALHTAVLFLLLTVGLLGAQTDFDVMATLVSATPGGMTARRLLPVALCVPVLLGAARLWGEKRGLYGAEFGVAIMVVGCTFIFSALIWLNALRLNRSDNGRRVAEARLQAAHDALEARVAERTAELVNLNRALQTQIAEREAAQEQKKLMEEKFLRSQRMESIGALAGGVAHDMNNALLPVLMASHFLREPGVDEERGKFLDLIESSAKRCTQMVKQILTFARGSQGEMGQLQIRHLIGEMTNIAQETFPKSISIHNEAARDLWEVNGDATELHQVLMNLCVNARDAMPEGGQLTVSARNCELAADQLRAHPNIPPGPFVVMSVSDTGTGIPPELLGRIFEPFFTTKPLEKGTGLGLSTVAAIIQRHLGFVEITSAVGKGTTFAIHLPAKACVQAEKGVRQEMVHPVGHGEWILLVDDESLIRELGKTTLENYGYRVLTAANGLEAVAAFEAHKDKVRLVVTDTDMPYLNGPNAILALRKIQPTIPIILTTGSNHEPSDTHGGCIANLSKPYSVGALLDAVADGLKRSSAVAAG